MPYRGSMHELSLAVEELTCKYCVRKVCEAIKALDGVVAVHVEDPPERVDGPADRTLAGRLIVRYVSDFLQPADISEAVAKAGYHVLKRQK